MDPNAGRDPRALTFAETEVEIDLSEVIFMRAPALLWCLIFALLAQRRSKVTVILPKQAGVLHWIMSLGFVDILRNANVSVTGTAEVGADPKVVLPLTVFSSPAVAENVVEAAFLSLERSGLGVGNLRLLVGQLFSELALNAVQHAKSPIGAYGYVQYYEFEEGPTFVAAVADGGIGIQASLHNNPELRYIHTDAHAIDEALRLQVTGTGEKNRGIGLNWVRERTGASPGRRLSMHSVAGAIVVEGPQSTSASFAKLFPGTSAILWIPT
jgi:hypothetical protein